MEKKVVELKWITKRAWELARAGAKAFGGEAKSYLKVALKEAWFESKVSFDKKGLQLMGYTKIDGTTSYTIISKYDVFYGKNGEYVKAKGLKGTRCYKNTFLKPFTKESIIELEKKGFTLSE